MHSESMVLAQNFLAALLLIFFIGTLGGRLAEKLQIPDVSVYILLGVVLGPDVLGWIHVSAGSATNQIVLLFGASFILFHGGTVTELHVLRKVWRTLTLLSTTGVLITAVVVALAATYLLQLPFLIALLLGSLLASTDPAALIPIFQRFPIRRKVAQTVITESAFTDATGAILAVVIFGILTAGAHQSGWGIFLQFVRLAFGGMLVGAVVGLIAAFLISENDRGLLREFTPMVVVLTVLSAYLGAEWIHASGFMAVFISGLMIGNATSLRLTILPAQQQAAHHFIDALGLKLRMAIFILLGSQVNLSALAKYAIPGLLIALIFMFIARPLTVLSSLLPDREAQWTRSEVLFFFWTRETGVIAAALTGIVAGSGLPEGPMLSAVVFIVILITIVLQPITTHAWAKKLGLMES